MTRGGGGSGDGGVRTEGLAGWKGEGNPLYFNNLSCCYMPYYTMNGWSIVGSDMHIIITSYSSLFSSSLSLLVSLPCLHSLPKKNVSQKRGKKRKSFFEEGKRVCAYLSRVRVPLHHQRFLEWKSHFKPFPIKIIRQTLCSEQLVSLPYGIINKATFFTFPVSHYHNHHQPR